MNLLGLSGSRRKNSFNTALLRAAAEHAPDGVELVIYDYRDVPFYDADIDKPAAVAALEAAIAAADGVLIATPEYNYGIPGVLKNAIDWASRPAYRSVFRDKPAGVMSASASFVGGARAQQQLKTVLLGMGTPVFPWPELLVGGASAAFEDGVLADPATRGLVSDYVAAFADWVARTRR